MAEPWFFSFLSYSSLTTPFLSQATVPGIGLSRRTDCRSYKVSSFSQNLLNKYQHEQAKGAMKEAAIETMGGAHYF